MIEIKQVSKTYQLHKDQDVLALKDITLNLPNHGLIFIVGKSGSGKSTLLNLIGGLNDIDKGEIVVCGHKLTKLTNSELNQYRNNVVGIVFQEYNLIPELNVEQNIQLTKSLQGKKYDKKLIENMLSFVGLSGYLKRKPNQLSGGQKQRVAIARSLVKESKVILADEPTGSLDSKTGEEVIKLLKKISINKLVIVVSHDQVLANRYADQLIELVDGHIEKHQMLTTNNDILEIKTGDSDLSQSNPFFMMGLSLALHLSKKKMIQTFFSVMYIALTISILFITMSTLLVKFDELLADVIENNQISLEKKLETSNSNVTLQMNDEDISYLQEQFLNLKLNPVKPLQIDYSSSLFNEVIEHDDSIWFTYTFGASKIDEDILSVYDYNLVAGSYPENINEIVITKYTYDIINEYEWKVDGSLRLVNDYQDIIGIHLFKDYYYGNMIVSGVIDTGDYESEILNASEKSPNLTLDNFTYSTLKYGGHNNIYVSSAYYDQLTTISTMGQYEYMEFSLNDDNSYILKLQSLNHIKDSYYLFDGYEDIGLNQGVISLNLLQQMIGYYDLNEYIHDALLDDVKNEIIMTKESIYNALIVYYPDQNIDHYDEWIDDTYYYLYVNLIYITLDELTVNQSVKDLSQLKYHNPFGPTGLELVNDALFNYVKDLNIVLNLSVFYDNQTYISQDDISIIGISIDDRSKLTLSDNDLNQMMTSHHIGIYDYVQMQIDGSNHESTLNIANSLLNQSGMIKYMDVGDYYQTLVYTKTNADSFKPILIGISIGFLVILVIYIWLITLLNLQMQKKKMGILYALGVNKKVFTVSFVSEMILIDIIAALVAIPLVYITINSMNFAYSQTMDTSYHILQFDAAFYVLTFILLLIVTTLINIIMTILRLKTNPYKLMKSK